MRPHLDFGFCPTHEVSEQSFTITNVGGLPVKYEWSINEPFQLIPDRGKLEIGESITTRVLFTPKDASVFLCTAVMRLDNRETRQLKLSGIGDYFWTTWI